MPEPVTRCRPHLGTFVEITAGCDRTIEVAFEAVARVHRLMSAHEPDSDISRINRFAHDVPVHVDPWTAVVLERAIYWAKRSEGAFDPVRAGKAASDRRLLPLHDGQPRPRAAHWTWLELTGLAARLLRPGCVDLGGIAKGFAVDRAIAALKAAGARSGFVNAGGDLAGFGPQPWPAQVVLPGTRRAVANVAVVNGAVATSALLPDGNDDHLPTRDRDLVSATVCAPAAIDADALTKVVLSGTPLADSCLEAADAQAFTITSGGAVQTLRSERQAA